MEKKVHDGISIEELLASLENKDLTEEYAKVQYNDPIASFLQVFEIEAGNNLVAGTLLHTLYRLWSKDTAMTPKVFSTRMGEYIPSKWRNRRFFEVNDSTLVLASKIQSLKKDKSRDITKSPFYEKAFQKFLSNTGLAKGKCWVENDVLYYVYRRWCDEKKVRKPISLKRFSMMMAKNFTKKRLASSAILWWGVNEEIQKLIDFEEVKRWREGRVNKSETSEDFSRPYDGYIKNVLYNGTWPKKEYK